MTPNASAGQHDDVLRMRRQPVRVGVRDEVERIAGPRVLGQARIVDIGHPGHRVEHDVFEHRAEAGDRRIDLGLGGRRQVDDLGVAAALEIEDALRAPAMLVVADQGARGVGRQGRLAGAGEAEEDRAVALRADIGRAVHRQHVARRQHEIEIAEHRFLDLAGIAGAADQHQPLGEIDEDEGLGADAVEFAGWRGNSGACRIVKAGSKSASSAAGGRMNMLRANRLCQALSADHPHRQPVFRIGAGIEILDEQLAALQVGEHPLVQAGEPRRARSAG